MSLHSLIVWAIQGIVFCASLGIANADTAPAAPAVPNLAPSLQNLKPAVAPWPRGLSPYELRAAVDVPLLTIGATIWILPYALLTEQLAGPACDPCDPSTVNAFDRAFIKFHDPKAGIAGDAMFYVLPAIWAAIELGDYGIRSPKGYFTDLVVLAETLAWSGTFDEIWRRSVRRPRPYLYEPDVYPEKRQTAEATYSFYSGHASAMFATAVMTAYTFHLRHPSSPWRYVVWTSLLSYATVQGLMRIFSGSHFPTDVLAGAAVGSAIGVLFPALHRRKSLPPTVRSLSLSPSSRDGVTSFAVSGRF